LAKVRNPTFLAVEESAMITGTQTNGIPIAQWYRGFGRVSAVVLFVIWLGLFVAEIARNKFGTPPIDVYFQAAALAFVFGGYVVGWRHELVGGLMVIAGTIAFFIVDKVTMANFTGLGEAALFAVPGVLYVLAWMYDQEPGKHTWRLL
jgi:hypothetical protein